MKNLRKWTCLKHCPKCKRKTLFFMAYKCLNCKVREAINKRENKKIRKTKKN